MVHTTGRGALPKPAIPSEFIDPHVVVQGDLYGKVEQTRLLDLDFTNVVEHPHMAIHSYMDCVPLLDGNFQWKWKP
jgi:hypothetical protein